MILCGDNITLLSKMQDNTYDSCVTDAPYGLGKEPDCNDMLEAWLKHGYLEVSGGGFMNKSWDAFVPQPNFWREVFRVLKPGAHVVCFFGTRTYDWGVMAMRLAGFEIRDQLAWIYGSGFPKGGVNISISIDKKLELIQDRGKAFNTAGAGERKDLQPGVNDRHECTEYTPVSELAKQWYGWNTALKPAFEPIVLARKPINEKTITDNIITNGVGGMNIDACRIGNEQRYNAPGGKLGVTGITPQNLTGYEGNDVVGRYPANVLLGHHEDCIFMGIDKIKAGKENGKVDMRSSTGEIQITTEIKSGIHYGEEIVEVYHCVENCPISNIESQSKGASRFFYCGKTSSDEREVGVKSISDGIKRANNHPTVKPIELMRWLCRLITPKGGKIIEPFGGSGTTGVAAKMEFMECDIIEMDEYWCKIAEERIKVWKPQYTLNDFFI